MEINICIGARLREVREALELSQTEFAQIAERAGVPGATRQSQAKYEKGLATPGAAYLAAIAAAGADVLYILTGQRAGGAPSVPALDAAEQVLLDSYRRCGATAKQNLIQTAALLSAGLGGSGVATVAHATGGVSQSNVHGSNHFVAGDSATSMPTKRRVKAA